MKPDKHFAIKLNAEKVLITTLLLLSIIFISLFVKQKSEIEQLKSEIAIQRSQYNILGDKVDELESQTSDLESKVGDLESNSNY